MLIFTYKLEKYVKKVLLPKILIDPRPSKYSIKGSFRRRIPYVTDIDIVNNVYHEINKSNIHKFIVDKINSISKDSDIILYSITCGTDDRFKLNNVSKEAFENIKSLLSDVEISQFNTIVKKYDYNHDKMIFFINELIWEHYKIRWTASEILQGSKKIAGNKIVKFSECIEKSISVLFQFFVKIDEYPIGVDMVVNYEPIENVEEIYRNAATYLIKLANYSKEYYYMLFPFRNFFKDNKDIRQDLEDIIEKKYGLYKQIMVRIDSYHTLYDHGYLDLHLATKIVNSIVKDVVKLPNFKSNIIDKLKDQAFNNDVRDRLESYYILLDSLYDDVNADVNRKSEKYFYKYLSMLPENLKSSYLLANDYRKQIPLKYSVR